MVKETVTYPDYNGLERTEDFYFNLSEAEVMEMETSIVGGMTEMLRRIVAAQDTPAIVKIFKELMLKSYGVKSPDGRRFMKSKEITEEFVQTEAYSKLFMKYATDADAAAKFINGIIPNKAGEAKSTPAIALATN